MLNAQNIGKTYPGKRGSVVALDQVSLHVSPGEFVVLRGHSGCGKSTLLMALGGMLHPSAGRILLNDTDIYSMSQHDRAVLRRHKIGFVFQMFHLVPYLNAQQNVSLACDAPDRESAAQNMLAQLGLEARTRHYPAELSAGERQRTAIARAFINKPELVLSDEPTGNLDPENAARVIQELHAYTRSGGAVILATHGAIDNAIPHRTLQMADGKIIGEHRE